MSLLVLRGVVCLGPTLVGAISVGTNFKGSGERHKDCVHQNRYQHKGRIAKWGRRNCERVCRDKKVDLLTRRRRATESLLLLRAFCDTVPCSKLLVAQSGAARISCRIFSSAICPAHRQNRRRSPAPYPLYWECLLITCVLSSSAKQGKQEYLVQVHKNNDPSCRRLTDGARRPTHLHPGRANGAEMRTIP